jgi:hypothetical protein
MTTIITWPPSPLDSFAFGATIGVSIALIIAAVIVARILNHEQEHC